VTTSIAEDTETAMHEDATADEDLRVYSDRSMIEGGVGGAAVIMRDGEEMGSKRFYLGSDQEHTVYEAEIVGMILAVQLLKEAGGNRGGTMSLGINNQAAITATSAFQSRPGHYLMDAFHDDLRSLIPEHDNRKLVIRWSPGHEGIEGNEAADSQAKRAARGETSDARELPKSLLTRRGEIRTLPQSKSATKQRFNKIIKEEAKTLAEESPRYALLRSVDPSAPSGKFTKTIDTLPRRHSSLIFQLRTGHIPLNEYLHRIAKAPSARCPKCESYDESVHHFLLGCPEYAAHRATMRAEVGHHQCHIKYLLSERKGIRATLTYVARTRRLEATFGDVTPPKE
jgi:ribonuclease HI